MLDYTGRRWRDREREGDRAAGTRSSDKEVPHKFSNKIDSVARSDLKLNTSRPYQRRLIESGVEKSRSSITSVITSFLWTAISWLLLIRFVLLRNVCLANDRGLRISQANPFALDFGDGMILLNSFAFYDEPKKKCTTRIEPFIKLLGTHPGVWNTPSNCSFLINYLLKER